jgi:hypothetical protein
MAVAQLNEEKCKESQLGTYWDRELRQTIFVCGNCGLLFDGQLAYLKHIIEQKDNIETD